MKRAQATGALDGRGCGLGVPVPPRSGTQRKYRRGSHLVARGNNYQLDGRARPEMVPGGAKPLPQIVKADRNSGARRAGKNRRPSQKVVEKQESAGPKGFKKTGKDDPFRDDPDRLSGQQVKEAGPEGPALLLLLAASGFVGR